MKHLAVSIGTQFFSSGGNGANVFAVDNLTGVSKVISLFLKGSFALAGLILLFYFIFGGIGIMSSAGKNDPKGMEQAKATITSALVGFVVVFTAYWIVKLIGTLLNIPYII